MSSTEKPAKLELRDSDLTACSVLGFSALLLVFNAAYSGIAGGVFGRGIALYTVVALVLCAGLIYCIVKVPKARMAALIAAGLVALEALLGAKYAVLDTRHHVETARINGAFSTAAQLSDSMLTFHPTLGIIGRAGFHNDTYTINEQGWRVSPAAVAARPTVLVVGGSTSFGYRASDAETWPAQLAEAASVNVINLGMPGYTSAEHVVQTAFYVPDFEADCALYYVGWNDLQMLGMTNLDASYSEYHMRVQYGELGAAPSPFKIVRPSQWERSAIVLQAASVVRALVRERTALLNEEIFEPRLEGARTDAVTPEALAIFERNMHQVAAMNKARGLRTIFIPQVLNASAWTSERPHSWIPLVAGRDVPRMMAAYNTGLARVGADEGVAVLTRVLEVDWKREHFVDHGHFSPSGNALFAATIAPDVQRLCRAR